MTIKKKNKVLWTVLCLVGILAVGIATYAYSGATPTTVIENAGGVTINNPVQPVEEERLGAVVSADTLPSMVCSADLCTYTMTGSFADATTTILAFADPFVKATSTSLDVVLKNTTNSGYGLTGATSTVDMVMLEITGVATSTFSVDCGVAAYDGTNGASTPTVELLSTATNSIATSSKGVLENNLTAALGGIVDAGTIVKVTLNPNYPYFTCLVTSVYPGAFTETTNTFDGKWAVKVHKTR
jgi:hypothetical protein